MHSTFPPTVNLITEIYSTPMFTALVSFHRAVKEITTQNIHRHIITSTHKV
jgi:hypothetical protein